MKRVLTILTAMVMVLTATLFVAQPASAWTAPNLVSVGDSHASGEGNAPYITGTDTSNNQCHRSNKAYGPLLERYGVVKLQAFRACSGATTQNVLGGQYNEKSQLDAITNTTDIVVVQALGNNFGYGQLVGLCIVSVCGSKDPQVVQTIQAINSQAPAMLDSLYGEIKKRLGKNGRAIALQYANPFPKPGEAVGPNCSYMTSDELLAAHNIASALNEQIRKASKRHGFSYAELGPLFNGADVCGTRSAFYPVSTELPQAAWLHPNQAGQVRYAIAVGARIVLNF